MVDDKYVKLFIRKQNTWEQRKLGDVVKINPKTELPNQFKYVDLESVVGTNLIDFKLVNKADAPSRAQRLASYGDVFYQTVRPYQRNNYLFEEDDQMTVFSSGYAQLRSNINGYFLLTLVQHDNFVKEVLDNCTGTSYPAITGNELAKINVNIPKDKGEINKIGESFRHIDNLITLHQRKLNKLEKLKKAYLEELFPDGNQCKPKRRFKDFKDDWEQRKLGDMTSNIGDGLHGTPKYDDSGEYYFINGNNLNGYKVIIDNETKKVAENQLSNDDKRLNENSILMSINGTIGTLARYNGEKIMLGKSVSYINPSGIDRNYLYYYLQNDNVLKTFYKNLTGTTIKNLGLSVIKETFIMKTTIDEEFKIGKFFENVDNLITLHQHK